MAETITMSLKARALAYAGDGTRIFPCWPGTKVPMTTDGFKSATCDLEQVETWWSKTPNANIAMCPDTNDWLVVDLDRAKSEAELPGEMGWQHACEEHGYSEQTLTIRTPSGGRHKYFLGNGPSTTRTLFSGSAVDTRGEGGYILLPPSVVGGQPYVVETDAPIAPMPGFVKDGLARTTRSAPATAVAHDDLGNLARARNRLTDCARRAGAGAAGSRSSETYLRACEVRDCGVSLPSAMVLLEQIWFPLLAQPADDPFPLEQLRQTTENAYRHAKNGAGAHAASDPVEAFGDVIGSVDNIPNVSKFKLRTREDRKNQKPLDWLVPGVLLDKNVVFLYGRWGSFKSYLALDLGLSVSTGTPWCGVMPKTGPVIYACGEGMVPLETSRAPAWEHAKGVEAPGFYTCPAPLVVLPDEAKDFCTEIAKVCENPALIIIDTLAKSALGLDLNSSVDAGKIAAFCKLIQERFNCCVMVVHHSGKDSERGMLGSILLPSNADSVLEVIRPKDKCPAVELWVRKFKDAPEPEEAFRFEMEPHLTDIVPKQITPERLRELTSDEDELKPAVVGKALRELGEPVTTHVLASALAPDAQGGDVEARQKAVRQFERRLKKAASGVLAAYVTDGIWSVPS